MKDVFIVGSKGIPANYGGFETFVDNLVTRQVNPKIKYHVSCMTFNKSVKQYDYNAIGKKYAQLIRECKR